jgi:hypothetical protein
VEYVTFVLTDEEAAVLARIVSIGLRESTEQMPSVPGSPHLIPEYFRNAIIAYKGSV